MMEVLGFEDYEECIAFCEHHGLATDNESVIFSRATQVLGKYDISMQLFGYPSESRIHIRF